jgi:glycosyltransferase involved in cell wall biosynthesis
MSVAEPELVEVRTPTFRRPNLLRRALTSLIEQSHSNWICRVFDDCPEYSAKSVCRILNDHRIIYEPNSKNIGIGRNIDKSFSIAPMHKTNYICVLEDDNYYLNEKFEKDINQIKSYNCDILLRNQKVEHLVERDMPGALTTKNVFDGVYNDGLLLHARLFASFFYSPGATNSSLFWRSGKSIDFSTLAYSSDPVVQERMRTLCIDRDVVVAEEPLVVWRDNGAESLRPKLRSQLEWRLAQIGAAAEERSIYRALYSYLLEINAERHIFNTTVGSFTADKERVFVRVGIAVPDKHRKMTFADRLSVTLKRLIAQSASVLLPEGRPIKIDPKTHRLVLPS